MSNKKGVIFYDDWTCNFTHYVSMILSYWVRTKSYKSSRKSTSWVPKHTLIALSSMAQQSDRSKRNCDLDSFDLDDGTSLIGLLMMKRSDSSEFSST